MDQRTCLDCQKMLPPSTSRSGNKRCSPCAREFRSSLTCLTCGLSLADRRATRFCSKRCTDIHRGKIRPAPLTGRVCELPSCGVIYLPSSTLQRCCSNDHVRRLWRLENPERIKAAREPWNDKRRDAYHRRRALKKGATTGNPVIYSEIALRDGQRCHICARTVSADLAYPDPMSGSLDHVIPLSRGGPHDPANVRLAHLRCNVSKGDRSAGDQLLLFG